ncbi:hypothetical protein Pmani_009783 [Petrolisthes manimaculis]|uniref:Uncharacterized protein n=1 Tax=Petrolisthes manimaculis TaxID=1843537 RepID=A0AAE1Q2T2_9EUCA|nr:hypothetical protein Pmani_009783 [Petrolisthes manimaculis]
MVVTPPAHLTSTSQSLPPTTCLLHPQLTSHAEKAKQEAEALFEECSDAARQEIKHFHRGRVRELQEGVENYVALQLSSARSALSIISTALSQISWHLGSKVWAGRTTTAAPISLHLSTSTPQPPPPPPIPKVPHLSPPLVSVIPKPLNLSF